MDRREVERLIADNDRIYRESMALLDRLAALVRAPQAGTDQLNIDASNPNAVTAFTAGKYLDPATGETCYCAEHHPNSGRSLWPIHGMAPPATEIGDIPGSTLATGEPPSEPHHDCHDLVCNGNRTYPRGVRGHGCSCIGRDERREAEVARLTAERDEARAWNDRLTGVKFSERVHVALTQRVETAEAALAACRQQLEQLLSACEVIIKSGATQAGERCTLSWSEFDALVLAARATPEEA